MWSLIIIIATIGGRSPSTSVSTINGFQTEKSCKQAVADVYKQNKGVGVRTNAYCMEVK